MKSKNGSTFNLRVVTSQPIPQMRVPAESLENFLLKQILSPTEIKIQRTKIIDKPDLLGISSEKRESMFINEHGIPERIQEEILYIQTLQDGTPINKHGITRCQTCNSIVSVSSVQRCPCGKTCCISKGCGCYVKRHDVWYCSKKHATIALLKINLRWIT